MNRLLRSCLVFTVAMICFAAFGYAQVRGGLAISRGLVYSVKLTATPGPTGGFAALATTVYSKDPNSMASAPPDVVTDSRLHYTYARQRTWPCVGATATSSSGATTNVGLAGFPLDGYGKYTVTVHVNSVDPVPLPPGYSPLPALIGEASATFTMWPPNNVDLLHFSVNPASGSHAPVVLHLTMNFVPAASGTRYIFNLYTLGGQFLGIQDSAQSSYVWTKTIATPGPQFYAFWVEEIRQSDCAWLRRAWTEYKYEVAP